MVSSKTLVDIQLGRNIKHPIPLAGDGFIVPNYSGDHSEGRVDTTPTQDLDLVNKKYVDDSAAVGDTTLANTKIWIGDSGGTKKEFALSGDVTMTAGGVTTITDSSHTIVSHDTTGTGAELTQLTDGSDTTLHDHDGISENTTHRSSDGSDHSIVGTNTTAIGLNTTHAADNTQAHSDYLLNNAVDIGVQMTLTGDEGDADTQYTAQVLYNTDATPPTASNFPIGTIYIQYTA